MLLNQSQRRILTSVVSSLKDTAPETVNTIVADALHAEVGHKIETLKNRLLNESLAEVQYFGEDFQYHAPSRSTNGVATNGR